MPEGQLFHRPFEGKNPYPPTGFPEGIVKKKNARKFDDVEIEVKECNDANVMDFEATVREEIIKRLENFAALHNDARKPDEPVIEYTEKTIDPTMEMAMRIYAGYKSSGEKVLPEDVAQTAVQMYFDSTKVPE